MWKIPSGKHTKNYGKSPCLISKSTINGPFSIAMLSYQRVISWTQLLAFVWLCWMTNSPIVSWYLHHFTAVWWHMPGFEVAMEEPVWKWPLCYIPSIIPINHSCHIQKNIVILFHSANVIHCYQMLSGYQKKTWCLFPFIVSIFVQIVEGTRLTGNHGFPHEI